MDFIKNSFKPAEPAHGYYKKLVLKPAKPARTAS
jgi:hypothetical protein